MKTKEIEFTKFAELVGFANSYMDELDPEKKALLARDVENQLERERDSIGIECVIRTGKLKKELAVEKKRAKVQEMLIFEAHEVFKVVSIVGNLKGPIGPNSRAALREMAERL